MKTIFSQSLKYLSFTDKICQHLFYIKWYSRVHFLNYFPSIVHNCKYMNHKTENQEKLRIIFQKLKIVPYIYTV